MTLTYARIASTIACILAGAALAVSLTHGGPAGPRGSRGPQGQHGTTGHAAQVARLGICWNDTYQTSGTSEWVTSIAITAPLVNDGVYTCVQGATFTSIVPQTSG
jgi:hypothetical protein